MMTTLAVCRYSLTVILIALIAGRASAEVRVQLDSNTVQANESFTMVLIADGGEQGDPEIDGLTEHFDILGSNQRSNISIINGKSTSTRRWIYALLPKASGEFEVPALSVGGVASEPVRITVLPAPKAAPGEADVFFEVSVDRENVWVQGQVIYIQKLHLGVATRQQVLYEPEVEGGEVLLELIPEDRRYERDIGGRNYTVIERRYVMFPQTSGEFTIAPARFSASLWERGRISNQKVFTSAPVTVNVKPAEPPPAAFPNAAWLPATELAINAELQPDDGILDPGEPASLRLEVVAQGLLPEQLPEVELAAVDGLRVYPDQPDLQREIGRTGLRSARQQDYAVIAARGGVFELPEVGLPWFNTGTGSWEFAQVGLPQLRAAGVVTGAAPAPAPLVEPEPLVAENPEPAEVPAATSTADRQRLFRLKLINYLLFAGWMVTLWVLWRMQGARRKQRSRSRREASANAPFRATQKAFKQLNRACRSNDPDAARAALLDWAKAFWPDARIRTLGDVAQRLPVAERQPIEALSRFFYGKQHESWDGEELRKALHKINQPGSESRLAQNDPLPPLLASGD